MVLTSTTTVWMGALRARDVRRLVKESSSTGAGGQAGEEDKASSAGGSEGGGPHHHQQATVLDARGALMMPVMGSLVLVLFYFLFNR